MLKSISILPMIAAVLFVLVTASIAAFFILLRKKIHGVSYQMDDLYKQLSNDIRSSIHPKFIQLSVDVDYIMELAIEVWRIEQRLNKISSTLPENAKKGMFSSIEKLKKYLSKYDVEYKDYTGQKFNDGLNLDVLSVETDFESGEPMIKETVEPAVMYRGQLVKRAKIIVLGNAA